MDTPDSTVTDETANHRFVVAGDGDGPDAELVYRVEGDRLVLVHTEVPDAFRGRGIGGRLVQAAAARAARTGETLVPQCGYARRWLRDHPEVTDGLIIDPRDPSA